MLSSFRFSLPSMVLVAGLACCTTSQPVSVAPAATQAAATAPPTPPGPATYTVVDLMPAFWEFWAQAKDKDETTQVQLFQKLLVARYPEVYNQEVLGGPKDKPFAEALPARYHLIQGLVQPKMDIVEKLSRQIGQDMPRYQERFRQTFPDLHYTGKIYFMYSLGGFDGATRHVNGQEVLLFGLDMMAYVYGREADPEPFFHHEFFHIYHSQFLNHGEDIATALWREGLATYVAHVLNPQATGAALFGLPRNTPERVQAQLPRYAREIQAVLGSESKEDYARFFLGGRDEQATIPARSGYYLGYLVAEKLAKRHSLQDLAHASVEQLRPEIEQALTELQAPAVAK